jgi:hypothetical protein
MGEIESYKLNCDYMREQFSLPESTSLYALVNKIVEEYKILKDKLFIEESKTENNEANNDLNRLKTSTQVEPSQKEKKRGRPRKS